MTKRFETVLFFVSYFLIVNRLGLEFPTRTKIELSSLLPIFVLGVLFAFLWKPMTIIATTILCKHAIIKRRF